MYELIHAGRENPGSARAPARIERSRDVVRRIQDWVLKQEGLPHSPLRKALAYMGLSGLVYSRSERGTDVAALFYSVIEGVKLAAVEPDARRDVGCALSRRRALRRYHRAQARLTDRPLCPDGPAVGIRRHPIRPELRSAARPGCLRVGERDHLPGSRS